MVGAFWICRLRVLVIGCLVCWGWNGGVICHGFVLSFLFTGRTDNKGDVVSFLATGGVDQELAVWAFVSFGGR